MTLMKDAPLPTFNGTVRASLRKAALDVLSQWKTQIQVEEQKTRRGFAFDGQYFSGIRINGGNFTAYLCLFSDAEAVDGLMKQGQPDAALAKDGKGPSETAAGICQLILFELLKLFPEWSKNMTSSHSLVSTQKMPDEWLVTPISCGGGRLIVLFGYSGTLGVAEEDHDDGFTEARNMTFF
jgi:hypothetical protein